MDLPRLTTTLNFFAHAQPRISLVLDSPSIEASGSDAGAAALCALLCPATIVMIPWLEVIGSIPSALTVAVFGRSRRQVLKLPITKSDSVAVGLFDESVSARKLEKQPPSPSELRLTPSSKNSPHERPFSWLFFVNYHGTPVLEP